MKLALFALFATAATATPVTSLTVLDPWTYNHAMAGLGVHCEFTPACFPDPEEVDHVLAAAFLGITGPLLHFYILEIGLNYELFGVQDVTDQSSTTPPPYIPPPPITLIPLDVPPIVPPPDPPPPIDPNPPVDPHPTDVTPVDPPPDVPEPGTFAVAGLALAALFYVSRSAMLSQYLWSGNTIWLRSRKTRQEPVAELHRESGH